MYKVHVHCGVCVCVRICGYGVEQLLFEGCVYSRAVLNLGCWVTVYRLESARRPSAVEQLLYSRKVSLVQNFVEMHPDSSEENFVVYIFADTLTTPFHENLHLQKFPAILYAVT